jgi:hypothetical protein
MARQGIRFIAVFLVCLVAASILLEVDAVATRVINPITAAIARLSGSVLAALGTPNETYGTVIRGTDGFSVNILDGCNGMDVTAIVVSAVLAFPSTLAQKGLGIVLSMAIWLFWAEFLVRNRRAPAPAAAQGHGPGT